MSDDLSGLPLEVRFAKAVLMLLQGGAKTPEQYEQWNALTGAKLMTVDVLKAMASAVEKRHE